MSRLRLLLDHPELERGAVAAAEVIDDRLHVVHQLILRAGTATELTLEPAHYLVRAYLPDGEVLAREHTVRRRSGEAPVVVGRRPWLAGPPEASGGRRPDAPTSWARRWERTGSSWRSAPVEPGHSVPRPRRSVRPMAAPSGRTALWQVGGPKVPWRCIALPVRPGRLVIRRASTPRSAQDGGVETVMTPSDPVATAILGYLRAGLNGAAAMLVDCVLTASEQLDPVGGDPVGRGEDLDRALVVGYQLLSTGGVERGDDWPFDPLRRVPWLPDGHVIEAWSQLRRPDGNLALAREHLLAAVGQGIPLYTCGLRLLYDGLWLFDQQHHDKAVHEAFALVSGYASATAWEEPVTTFFGVDPTLPSPRPPTGLPPPAAVPEPAQLPAGLGRVVYARPAAMAAGRQAPAVHPARPFGRQTWELRADPHWQLSAQVDVRSYIRENAPVQAVHRGGHEVVVLATGEPLGRSWTTLPADEGDDVEQVLMAELGLRRAR